MDEKGVVMVDKLWIAHSLLCISLCPLESTLEPLFLVVTLSLQLLLPQSDSPLLLLSLYKEGREEEEEEEEEREKAY